MTDLPVELLQAYRRNTFRTEPGRQVRILEEAIAFVKQRGFVYFWPISGILMPSLWVAVAGDRPVADEHDDPGHVTWNWKDRLLGGRQWYYAKVLRKKATMISIDVAPYFYAISENYGSPEEDYLTLYEQGRLTQEAKAVYEAILDNGPLDTLSLRKKARLANRESESRFNRAITDLQADFKLVPIAVSEAGGWRYAFVYEITARHYPEISEQAHHIQPGEARAKLTELYFKSIGAARPVDLQRLFHWRPREVERAIDSLVQAGLLKTGAIISGQSGEWLVLSELLDRANQPDLYNGTLL